MCGKMARSLNYVLPSCLKLVPLHYPFFPKTDSEIEKCKLILQVRSTIETCKGKAFHVLIHFQNHLQEKQAEVFLFCFGTVKILVQKSQAAE